MRTDDLLALFGGREAVERITGASRNAISNWRYTGVPYRHWPALRREARRLGLRGISDETLALTRAVASEPAE